jgi:hypothetical protein
MEDNFKKWIDNLTHSQIQHILFLEYNRKQNLSKYFNSEKGKAKRRELNKKYYLQRKARKELVE